MLKRILASSIVCLFLSAFILLSTDTVLTSCSGTGCGEIRWGYENGAFNSYNVGATMITPSGIRYDPSGMSISPELIDRLTSEVEECMQLAFPNRTLSQSDASAAYCQSSSIVLPIRRDFVVKVANDWVLSCDKSEQLLLVLAGSPGCIAKGVVPTETCPCRWRAGVRCPNELIVTPSFYLYKDVLIRYAFQCSNPWASPTIALCASPSTSPLSDGSDPKGGLQ